MVTSNALIQVWNGGGGGGGKISQEKQVKQIIPIGCCPAGDPTGKPYGPGKACCCGTVYNDDGSNFCCDANCEVYSNTLSGITKCNLASPGPEGTYFVEILYFRGINFFSGN